MFDVAVVGNGASAVFTLLQLARLAPAWRVAQIAGTEPGHGIAYSSASNLHLLNVPADRMGAPPEQPDHFWRWLEVNGRCGTCQSTDFVPRRWYGDYLQSIHESFDPVPHRYRQRLEAMDRADDDGWRLRLSDGTAVEARRLVLGLGLPSLEAPWPARPGIERDGWRWWQNLPSDWRPPAADQQIVLVGSGLTAIDLAVGLRERGFRGHIRAISPSGRWSEPHARSAQSCWPTCGAFRQPAVCWLSCADIVRSTRGARSSMRCAPTATRFGVHCRLHSADACSITHSACGTATAIACRRPAWPPSARTLR